MPAGVKLKGIDGGPHKRWSMWFNSIIREKPYQGFDMHMDVAEMRQSLLGTCAQVLHGCRQLVS